MNILVSGASFGLGYELARIGLEQGHTVVAGVRLKDGTAQLNALPVESRSRLFVIPMDVSSDEEVRKAAEATAVLLGRLDTVINVAGVNTARYEGDNPLQDIRMDEVSRLFNVNVFGSMRVVKYFLPLLLKSEHPALLNITSEAGGFADYAKDYAPYSLSKTAMNIVSYRIGNILGDRVRTLAVHPGRMKTPMSGGKGDILPAVAAEGILDLAFGNTEVNAGLWFVDYLGRPMPF